MNLSFKLEVKSQMLGIHRRSMQNLFHKHNHKKIEEEIEEISKSRIRALIKINLRFESWSKILIK